MGIFSKKRKKNRASPAKCTAVIVAAGTSSRMGEDKLFLLLGGMPVIAYTLRAFESCDCIERIVIVTREEKILLMQDVCREYGIIKAGDIVKGGETRAESVYAGVAAAGNAEFVCIHDGARPLIKPQMIEDTFLAAVKYGAACPGVPVKDTVKVMEPDGFSGSTPPRNTLIAAQTPQAFDTALIKGALYSAIKKGIQITDDCSAVEAIGMRVRITEGDYENIKITTPEDIYLAEAIMDNNDML